MTRTEKIKEDFWFKFLEYLRENENNKKLQYLVVVKTLDDIFWLWYADYEMGGIPSALLPTKDGG